jgi:hypothetical protein
VQYEKDGLEEQEGHMAQEDLLRKEAQNSMRNYEARTRVIIIISCFASCTCTAFV